MKIDWTLIDPLIGTRPDSAIAREFGVSHTIIARRRRLLGKEKAPERESSINWVLYDAMLGTESDVDVAKKLGCSKRTVQRRRNELNIKPFTSSIDSKNTEHIFKVKIHKQK